MLDGLSPDPAPPRPAPLDTRALLPLLQAEAAEIGVEMLAMASAENAMTTVRWLALNWGKEADLRDRCHPARAAAQDPASPAWKLAEAQAALATACWRYRVATGHDGLALARRIVGEGYGPTVAAFALKPLLAAAAASAELDAIIAGDTPEPELLAREPEPPPAQRQAAIGAVADWMLSDPRMDDVARGLRALLAAVEIERCAEPGPAATEALAALAESIDAALRGGCEPERMQLTLDTGAKATGGPRITVSTDEPPAT